MLNKLYRKIMLRAHLSFDGLSFSAVLTCVLLGAGTAAPAFGQMGSYAIYSDAWLDDSNPSQAKMYGCGVTQDYNNIYGHTRPHVLGNNKYYKPDRKHSVNDFISIKHICSCRDLSKLGLAKRTRSFCNQL